MYYASELVGVASAWGHNLYTGVPCSFLAPLINEVIDSPDCDYYGVNNEGEAIALAAGGLLAGRKPIVMFQNSGLGNAVNPIASLLTPFDLPMLLICTWRGEPTVADEPQHLLMGQITPDLLSLLDIQHELLPDTVDGLNETFARAHEYMAESKRSYALIMKKDTLHPQELKKRPTATNLPPSTSGWYEDHRAELTRTEALKLVLDQTGELPLIATTGKTGRELYAIEDKSNHFYMVGSMGCASSLALGLALHLLSDTKVLVLDGDGAALMRLEAMASIGHFKPGNLIHLILDNNAFDSTGGQQTLSHGLRFENLAIACGYATASSLGSLASFHECLARALREPGPHLIHLRILPGSPAKLPRPKESPAMVQTRFTTFLQRFLKGPS